MRKFACGFLLLSAVGLASACGDDDAGVTPPPAPKVLTFATYNAGLAVGFVRSANERAPITTDAVAQLGANVLCVQEYWLDEHVDLLRQATQASLPNTAFITPDPGVQGDPACADGEVDPLLACVDANCSDVCDDELVSCAVPACGTELGSLSPECQGCIQANIGNTVDYIQEACEAGSTEYAYGGSFGIGLLTSFTVKASENLVLESTTNRRGILYAELETPAGDVHVLCTHLTAVFDDIPYPKPTGSWQEEQAVQIGELIALANERAGSEPIVVLGDMNTGVPAANFGGEAEENFGFFTDAGFAATAGTMSPPVCTFCADNPLVGNDNPDDSDSVLIDHVFTKNLSTGSTIVTRRILDEAVEVQGCDGAFEGAYSDHYGLAGTLTVP